jgi:hypothetical protein
MNMNKKINKVHRHVFGHVDLRVHIHDENLPVSVRVHVLEHEYEHDKNMNIIMYKLNEIVNVDVHLNVQV